MQIYYYNDPKKQENLIFGLFQLSNWCTYPRTPIGKTILAVILRGQPTSNNQRFLGFWAQFCFKKWASSTFQPDHQVNPENRPSKDPKSVGLLEFAIIG